MRLENNYTEILTALINKQNSEGLTALHYASFRGNIKIINILIQNGADISLVGIKGSSVMHLAAKGNQPSSLVLFKEKYKQSINILDNAEDTPLHVAAENGCDLALTFLLSWNANPNCQNKVGYTPLHLAVINGRVKAIKKLMQKGADPSLKDYKQNKSCVQYATETKNQRLIELFKERNICEILFFRPKIAKMKHSKINMIFYIIMTIIISIMTLFVILPYINSLFVTFVFIILFIFNAVLYILLFASDPGKIKASVSLPSLLSHIEENINDYCPYCITKKTSTTKHCIICGVCIDGFDHHCFWVGNCIGTNNYSIFLIFLISEIIFIFLNLIESVICKICFFIFI